MRYDLHILKFTHYKHIVLTICLYRYRFDKCWQSWNDHHNKYIAHIHLPQIFSGPFAFNCLLPLSFTPSTWKILIFLLVCFSSSRFHISWMRKYLGFCVWILSLSTMLLSVIHVVKWSNAFFPLNDIHLYGYILTCLIYSEN